MGTTYSLRFVNTRINMHDQSNELLLYNINVELLSINQVMSTYKNNSSISLINKSRNTDYLLSKNNLHFIHYISIKPKFIDKCIFSINVNHLVSEWGFNCKTLKMHTPKIQNLSNILIKDAFFLNSNNNKHLINKFFHKISYTLSASAKGYAVDQIYKISRMSGSSNLLVEIGGEIKSSGLNSFHRLWSLGLLEPHKQNLFSQYIKLLNIYNTSMASSGTYLNNVYYKHVKYTHIININNGMSINSKIKSISVLFPSCMISDIFGTVLISSNIKKQNVLKNTHNNLFISFYLNLNNHMDYFVREIL